MLNLPFPPRGFLIAILASRSALVLDLPADSFGIEAALLGPARGPCRAPWRLLVERRLDDLMESCTRDLPISLPAALAIRVNHQDPLSGYFSPQTGDQACFGLRF
jgi:hypothetical protein